MAVNRRTQAGATAAAAVVAGVGVTRWARRRNAVPGRVALVAGASRGLGFLIARQLAEGGARVAICARDRDELERAREDLRSQGHEVLAVECDVSVKAQVEDLVARVERELGPIAVLVNVAGIIEVGPVDAMSDGDFTEAMDTMYWGPFHLTRAVLPGMRERHAGRIATITSIGGKISVPHLLPYSAAKFAAVGFSEGLRAELAGTGVLVTTVVPGLMRTGSHLRAYFTGDQDAEYAWFSLGASLPLVSMDAERAARRIVSAIAAGRPEIQLTPLTKVATRVHGLAPSATTALLGVMARVLPDTPRGSGGAGHARRLGQVEPPPGEHRVDGEEADGQLSSAVLRRLTVLGRRAAQRFNETPG